ncbi:MAG: hypothetical protein K6G91_02210 [Kiritimatiellae bacterium]|nr:hypothetical protein [Kiritimatiellia bacterium]
MTKNQICLLVAIALPLSESVIHDHGDDGNDGVALGNARFQPHRVIATWPRPGQKPPAPPSDSPRLCVSA